MRVPVSSYTSEDIALLRQAIQSANGVIIKESDPPMFMDNSNDIYMKKFVLTCLLLTCAPFKANAEASSAQLLESRGEVNCKYIPETGGKAGIFSLRLSSNKPTDDVVVVRNGKWLILREEKHNFSRKLSISNQNSQSEVRIPVDIIIDQMRSPKRTVVFTGPAIYTIVVGQSLDSEESNNRVMCQYRYSDHPKK